MRVHVCVYNHVDELNLLDHRAQVIFQFSCGTHMAVWYLDIAFLSLVDSENLICIICFSGEFVPLILPPLRTLTFRVFSPSFGVFSDCNIWMQVRHL